MWRNIQPLLRKDWMLFGLVAYITAVIYYFESGLKDALESSQQDSFPFSYYDYFKNDLLFSSLMLITAVSVYLVFDKTKNNLNYKKVILASLLTLILYPYFGCVINILIDTYYAVELHNLDQYFYESLTSFNSKSAIRLPIQFLELAAFYLCFGIIPFSIGTTCFLSLRFLRNKYLPLKTKLI